MDGADRPGGEPLGVATAATTWRRSARRTGTLDSGEHDYVIRYSIDGVSSPARGDDLAVLLEPGPGRLEAADRRDRPHRAPPRRRQPVQCAVGSGATTGCTARGEGTRTLHVVTGPLEPNTPVTVKAGLDMRHPAAGRRAAVDRPLRPRARAQLVAARARRAPRRRWRCLGGLAAIRARERAAASTRCMYAPPEGIGPAQATYVFMSGSIRTAYVATLMYAAEKGAIDLTGATVAGRSRTGTARTGWAGLDPVTSGSPTCSAGPGRRSPPRRRTSRPGSGSRSEIGSFEEQHRRRGRRPPAHGHQRARRPRAGRRAGGAAATAVVTAIWNPFS